ncbi:MAG: energy-coupling factor transporter transmembrane protein EcfT [Anaerolineae bacterium]|nr:energy-coupling factor transporter transmembrane protein EcfT [Anaerolineae bacterium]
MFDPRSKLVLALAWSTLVMLATRWEILGIISIVTLGTVVVLDHTSAWLKTMRALVPMTLFLVAVMLWAFDANTALMSALRLLLLTTTFFLFFRTTAPEDMANALVASGAPYALAFIITTAMQFVPVLARKMSEVRDAQRARGIPLENNVASLRYYPALIVPLLIQTFLLAEQLAEAMEARGFGAPRRTFARAYVLQRHDWGLILVSFLLILVGWWLR